MSAELRSAFVVAVGDELLAGAHPDLNSPEIARRLADLGVLTAGVSVVPDDEHRIRDAVRAGWTQAPWVLVTGGLGPTLDDVTRHGIAQAAELELEHREEAWREIAAWFEERGFPLSDSNRRQALIPVGATVLPNHRGTAPGFRIELAGERAVLALPGPPSEMRGMLEDQVLPWVRGRLGSGVLEVQRFHLFGVPESHFAEEVGPWMDREADPRMGCSVKAGVLSVVLRGRGPSLVARGVEFRERFAGRIFSEELATPEEVLGRRLIEAGIEVTVAESCTAGLAASMLARVPGISAVLQETYVTYSNAAKTRRLGVPAERLAECGAVSEEVALDMALGAARAAGARAALSITGVAGPGGGTPDKPVGTVCFGVTLDGRSRTVTRAFSPKSRDHIRLLAARTGLHLLLGLVEEAGAAPGPHRGVGSPEAD